MNARTKEDVDKYFAEREADAKARVARMRPPLRDDEDREPVECDRCGAADVPKNTMGAFIRIGDAHGYIDEVKVNLCKPCARAIYIACAGPMTHDSAVEAMRADCELRPWKSSPWDRIRVGSPGDDE